VAAAKAARGGVSPQAACSGHIGRGVVILRADLPLSWRRLALRVRTQSARVGPQRYLRLERVAPAMQHQAA